ncbi:hypothetical protein V3C99_002346 [Haemonchus contortus]|uniref:Solute carrier family 13 member 2 n=1 Tax=Haemonchus contortus TaxID=6289 RepID=A0A7I4YA82_HAECO|nr:Sodium sulphate symporter domain containing protein [Haemonchus contortus]
MAVSSSTRRWSWIIGTPLVFSPLLFFGLPFRCAFCILVLSIYWIVEVVPIGVTSLMPIFLFPVLGIESARKICLVYFKDSIVLFICIMTMTLAVEETGLHRRIALKLLCKVGTRKQTMLLGFMCTTALLSCFFADTACTALMIPIALAIIRATNNMDEDCDGSGRSKLIDLKKLPRSQRGFCKALVLACAHGSLIGGTAIITSTGPNLVFREIIQTTYPNNEIRVSFVQWMAFAIPPVLLYLSASFLILTCFFIGPRQLFRWCSRQHVDEKRLAKAVEKNIHDAYKALGPFTFAEKSVLCWFGVLMSFWIMRKPGFIAGWGDLFPNEGKFLTDSVPGILIVFLMFAWPRDPFAKDHSPILTWPTMQHKFTWSCMLLIGAGYAISEGVEKSGLSTLIACAMKDTFGKFNSVQLQIMIAASITAMTEFASNVSTGSILIPIVISIAESLQLHPLYLAMPATVACSFAFMLPMATPPNAIVFDTKIVGVLEMFCSGVLLNICCILITALNMNTWTYWLFDLGTVPLVERHINATLRC